LSFKIIILIGIWDAFSHPISNTFYATDAATTVGIITLRIMTPNIRISKVDTDNGIDHNDALSWVVRVVVVMLGGYL
jgi:hypothetical protein